ncbi:MAG: O-antigen ligase family protein [Opitutus sp.]
MHATLRALIAAVAGSVMAIWVGMGIANETYFSATLVCMVCVWALLAWIGGPLPEAWVLAAALFGYVIGNRGFAQLSLSSRLPLLPAEVALMAGIAGIIISGAMHKTSAIRRDALNFSIIAWILIGAARVLPDMRVNGAVALRDFATVYYALFFFIAQSFAVHAQSARLLRRVLFAALVLLPFTYFLYGQFAEFFLTRLTVRNTPLLYYKDDLVAAFLFAAFFFIIAAPHWSVFLRAGLATTAFASAFTIDSSRAALVGLVVTSVWWAVARRLSPLKLQAAIVPAGVLVLLVVAFVSRENFNNSRIYQLYEHVASIADVTGTRRYTSESREFIGNNNRFRMWWWRSVAEQTWEEGPVFGLGFGADLADRFTRTYELDLGEEFHARSPHSIFFTVLGRMGIAGLLAFLCLTAAMTLRTLRAARMARIDDKAIVPLGWWSVAWMVFVSGWFGVVLEGPMGAVLFWTALGMANAETGAMTTAEPQAEVTAEPSTPSNEELAVARG